jgi:hypothetical protein
MKAIELLEKYPEAAKVINQFYHAKITDSMSTADVPEEFKEMLKQQEFDNEYIASFIDNNPRMLFDVFDDNELHIEILVMYSDRPSIFTYTVIEGDLIHTQPTKYTSRIEAEKLAIETAFQILNEKLCQIK